MIKRWFDWTPRDITAWEIIRGRGLGRFILWYGVGITGGGLFCLLVLVMLLLGLKDALWSGTDAIPPLPYLLLQGAFLAVLALVGGLVNSLITWFMEETIYRSRYAPPEDDLTANPPE